MPYCPRCGYEYEEGVEVCPDCEVELVDELSEDHFDGEMVEIFATFYHAEAGMVKELLYNEGIFCALSNELGSHMFGHVPSDAGEIRVYVSEEEQDKARELVQAFMEESPTEEMEEYSICPNCGAKVDEGMGSCPYCGEQLEE